MARSSARTSIFAILVALALGACAPTQQTLPSAQNRKLASTVLPRWEGPRPADDRALLAGRGFDWQGRRLVAADLEVVTTGLSFDLATGVASGTARIELAASEDGFAYFTLAAAPDSATLDGAPVDVLEAPAPAGSSTLRVIDATLVAGESHVLELTYRMPAANVTFDADGVRFLTAMSDIGSGNYFEAYGPANVEADHFALTLELEILAAPAGSVAAHRLVANGEATEVAQTAARRAWKVEFPSYFNTSSPYVHLTTTPLTAMQGEYDGIDGRVVQWMVYGQESADVGEAASRVRRILSELERDYGAYPHERFVAYISGRGGMEHAGATVTSVGALAHEITHSWFARGVMPADGRSGWMDEAIASWRDNGYRRVEPTERAGTNVAGFSLHEWFSPGNVYADGRQLLAELDWRFAAAGTSLKLVLRELFAAWSGHSITTEVFREFLEARSGVSLASDFESYVTGGTSFVGNARTRVELEGSLHPPALTRAEIRALR